MFDADHPIKNSEQDKLNRTTFAKYLARCMLDHQDQVSLVVGVEGGWGVGKTSILNLVHEELNFASSNLLENEQPITLNFNPWNYANQNQMINSFFNRLYTTFEEIEQLQDKTLILESMHLYASYFDKTLARPRPTKTGLWQKVTFRNINTNVAWESGRDVMSVKQDLDRLLARLPRKIIITIDNISRLNEDEIRQIFQIVKSLFDCSNTVYLLSFDQNQVIQKLNSKGQTDGKEYIEKIIQLPFMIPAISKEELSLIFEDRIQQIISLAPEEAWDKEYWADIYLGYLKHFFTHCRDITRYINSLSFSYPRVKDTVNPVDFFAITAIEIFLPEVYAGISHNKDLFSDLLDNVYEFTEEEIKEDKLRVDEILSHNKRIPKETLLELLMTLFPRLRHIYQPGVAFYHSDSLARRLLRICSPDLFEVYFRLSVSRSSVSSTEFAAILASANAADEFDHALARLNQDDDRVLKFLDHLDNETIAEIPNDNIPVILNALIDDADLFPQGVTDKLSLDTPMRIHRIIHLLLQRNDNNEDRFVLLQKAISKASKSLYIIVHELQEQWFEHHKDSDTYLPEEFRDVTSEQLRSLQQLAVDKIKHWANNNSLYEHPKLLPILMAWHEWGDSDECKAYLEKTTSTDKGLVAFLVAALNKAIDQAMTRYEKNPLWDEYLKDIETLISCKELEEHSRQLFEDGYFEKLREKEQLAIMIFLDLMKAQTKKDIPDTTGDKSSS